MTRVHIICGMCGCSTEFQYKIVKELNDNTSLLEEKVYIFCKNCSSLTNLDEVIKNK